jgi:glutamyl-tRNA synthetase
MFDVKKLEAINGDYIRALDAVGFVERSRPFFEAAPWSGRIDAGVLDAIAPEVQTRVKVLSEVPDLVDFFFLDEPDVDEASWQKAIAGNESAPKILDAAIDAYESATWDAETLHRVTTELAEAAGLKVGKAQAPIRVAVTGRAVGPPLFESLAVLGRDVTLTRLRAARARC